MYDHRRTSANPASLMFFGDFYSNCQTKQFSLGALGRSFPIPSHVLRCSFQTQPPVFQPPASQGPCRGDRCRWVTLKMFFRCFTSRWAAGKGMAETSWQPKQIEPENKWSADWGDHIAQQMYSKWTGLATSHQHTENIPAGWPQEHF